MHHTDLENKIVRVKDLIAKLQQLPQEAEVWVLSWNKTEGGISGHHLPNPSLLRSDLLSIRKMAEEEAHDEGMTIQEMYEEDPIVEYFTIEHRTTFDPDKTVIL